MGILKKLMNWAKSEVTKCKYCNRWIRNKNLQAHQRKCKKEQKLARKRAKKERRRRRLGL